MEKSEVFLFQDQPVTVVTRDGAPLWMLKDLCSILHLPNAAQVAIRLPKEEKDIIILNDVTLRGTRKRVVVTEAGMYRVLFRSDKREARAFQSWVFNEVLPQIRKTGSYSATNAVVRHSSSESDDRYQFFMESLGMLSEKMEEHQKALTAKNDVATATLLHHAMISEKLALVEAMVTKLPGRISNIVAAVVEEKIMQAVQPDNSEALDKVQTLKDALLQLETDLTSGH